jgi:hypothetical protein
MGHLGDGDELERAFAGATVHDMFNFLSVGILFPVELITTFLFALSSASVPSSERDGQGEKWEGPVKKLVSPLANLIIKANKDVTKTIAKGEGTCESGGVFYPVFGGVRLVGSNRTIGSSIQHHHTKIISGYNTLSGHARDHSSYRGELGGILPAIIVTNELC